MEGCEVCTHELRLIDEQDSCISLQIHPLGFLDDLQSADCDVLFIGEAEAHEVQHGESIERD